MTLNFTISKQISGEQLWNTKCNYAWCALWLLKSLLLLRISSTQAAPSKKCSLISMNKSTSTGKDAYVLLEVLLNYAV